LNPNVSLTRTLAHAMSYRRKSWRVTRHMRDLKLLQAE
jgi:hypothetical protein